METLNSVLTAISAIGTLIAAIYTRSAAVHAEESAIASCRSAEIAQQTIELARRADVLLRPPPSDWMVEWFIRDKLPHFSCSCNGQPFSFGVLSAGAGTALDTEVQFRLLDVPENEPKQFGFGGPSTDNDGIVLLQGGNLLRGRFHEWHKAEREVASREARVASSPEFGASRTTEQLAVPAEIVADIAYGAAAALVNEVSIFDLYGKKVRTIEGQAHFLDIDGRRHIAGPTKFSVTIRHIDLYDIEERVMHRQPFENEVADLPPPNVSRWGRARITLSVTRERD